MELIKNLKILRQKPNLSETLPIYHKFSDLQPYPILKPPTFLNSHTSLTLRHLRVTLKIRFLLKYKLFPLSDSNRTRTHNYLVYKWTLNHLVSLASLAKRSSVRLWTKWLRVRIPLLSLKLQILCLFRERSSMIEMNVPHMGMNMWYN